MLAWLGLLYFWSEWVIRLLMTPIVVRRRGPSAALAWLTIIFFLPWVGLFFYILLGGIDLGRRPLRRLGKSTDPDFDASKLFPQGPAPIPDGVPDAQHDLVLLSRNLGGAPALAGNTISLISDTDEFITSLISAIDNAEHDVQLLYYIFSSDNTGQRVARALERAAARGVRCRLLVDAVGSKVMLKKLAPRLRNANIECSAMLPVSLLRRPLARIDLRNHRKLAVIDSKLALAGSQNIVDADYGAKRFGAWRDLSIHIEGPAVQSLRSVFESDWQQTTGSTLEIPSHEPPPYPIGDTPVQIIPSGPTHHAASFRKLVNASLHEAQERVIMTSPYLVPDESFLQSLQLTTLRGIEVHIVIPERSNHRLVAAAGRAYYEELLEAGVHLHLHQDGLLHAKTMTVDNSFALVGSGNFDVRSFLINFELNMLLFGPDAAATVRTEQERYIKEARELSLKECAARSASLKTLDRIAMLASPLL